jgi:hypothetical protein
MFALTGTTPLVMCLKIFRYLRCVQDGPGTHSFSFLFIRWWGVLEPALQIFHMPSTSIRMSWTVWWLEFNSLPIILSNVDETLRDPSLRSHFRPFWSATSSKTRFVFHSHGHPKMCSLNIYLAGCTMFPHVPAPISQLCCGDTVGLLDVRRQYSNDNSINSNLVYTVQEAGRTKWSWNWTELNWTLQAHAVSFYLVCWVGVLCVISQNKLACDWSHWPVARGTKKGRS